MARDSWFPRLMKTECGSASARANRRMVISAPKRPRSTRSPLNKKALVEDGGPRLPRSSSTSKSWPCTSPTTVSRFGSSTCTTLGSFARRSREARRSQSTSCLAGGCQWWLTEPPGAAAVMAAASPLARRAFASVVIVLLEDGQRVAEGEVLASLAAWRVQSARAAAGPKLEHVAAASVVAGIRPALARLASEVARVEAARRRAGAGGEILLAAPAQLQLRRAPRRARLRRPARRARARP
mmetsp:Transcript_1113/g.3235  ORF Transcript_1113/g.3235 Transcript_1113/m.3235 type:complete len:240 (+) Transcript_1113:739-1458(+)